MNKNPPNRSDQSPAWKPRRTFDGPRKKWPRASTSPAAPRSSKARGDHRAVDWIHCSAKVGLLEGKLRTIGEAEEVEKAKITKSNPFRGSRRPREAVGGPRRSAERSVDPSSETGRRTGRGRIAHPYEALQRSVVKPACGG
eukprot:scaffold7027_cov376-Pinguiococcus_pyrenoidosus.AAC.3